MRGARPGHNSALVYLESQIDYIVRAVRLMLERNLAAIDVRKDRQAEFNRHIQRRLARTTWNSGCPSWYLTDEGLHAAMYPGFATQFARQLANLDLEDYQVLNHAHGRSASC